MKNLRPFLAEAAQRSRVLRFVGSCALMGTLSIARAQSTYSTPYTFSTVAGASSLGSADGTGSAARFNYPYGAAVDGAGNVYVADVYNNTIRKITSAGVVTTLAGLAGTSGSADGIGSAARFGRLGGLAIDNAGILYVADEDHGTIRRITSAGVVTTLAGSPGVTGSSDGTGSAAQFNVPSSVAVDGAGTVYVADTVNSTIRKITSGGVVTTFAGVAGATGSTDGAGSVARFTFPAGVAVDAAGNVYVGDSSAHTIRKITSAGVVSTLAGTTGSSGSIDGTGTAAKFNRPTGLALDGAGNIYVADQSNATVRKIAAGNIVTTFAGAAAVTGSTDGIASVARFSGPNSVAVDGAGNVYVAESANATVRKITSGGVVTTLAGAALVTGSTDGIGSAARFNFPTGMALDSGGNLFISDARNNTIRKMTVGGVVTTFAGTALAVGSTDGIGSAARFNVVRGLAIDRSDNLYVAEEANHTIRKITSAGVVTTLAGLAGTSGSQDGTGSAARFKGPRGVAVDNAGNVYVADYGNYTIRKITSAGVVTTLAGQASLNGSTDGTGSAARFYFPYGIAVDGSGNVYVAEIANDTIRKITSSGVVTTLAGSALVDGSVDGTGSAARFYQPLGLAVDGSGNIFVADGSNQTIRKITSSGVVTTVAGLVGIPGSTDGTGIAARFYAPSFVTLDGAGGFYVSEQNNVIRHGIPSSATTSSPPGIVIPRLIPSGATTVDARALTQTANGSVIVAVSGSYAVRPGSGAQPFQLPDYTNPQPYNLSYVVRLLANGQPDPAFTSAPGGDGTVNTVVVQSDGKILVGGTFTTFNGVLFRNLARLNADGKADATFVLGSGFDAQVNAIATQADGKILVGGAFQNFGGQSHPYLVRLNSTGTFDSSFAPGINGLVDTLVVQPDGKILVGGNFTSAGGTARGRIARLLTSGAIDSSFDPGLGASDEVVTLRLQGDGAIVAGGDFTTFAGQTRNRIARILTTGALDPAFLATASANATVISLGLEASGNIILGGAFTQINGVNRNRLARLLPDGTLDLSFDPADGANKDVRAVLPSNDGTIFLGGLFDQYQGTNVNEVVAVTGSPVATSLLQSPSPLTVNPGGTARFVAAATGAGVLTYQWFREGIAIAGATEATLTLTNVSAASQGRYTLQVTSSTGSSITTPEAVLTIANVTPGQIVNLSVLTSLDTPGATFTLGFVLGGTGTSGAKQLLVRAGGPSLAQFGVGNPLADPKLQFYAGPTLAGENDNWEGSAVLGNLMVQVGAFPYVSAASKDAAYSPANLTTAANSVVVSGVGSTTGTVIAEVYDATSAASVTAATPRLINVSVLKNISVGSALTAGFVVGGATSKTVLIRVVGPTLSGFGIGDPLADPQLNLYQSGVAAPIGANDNWNGTLTLKNAFAAVGAFPLEATTKDAALLMTLAPGSYTAQATGVGSAAGTALVEVYEVP